MFAPIFAWGRLNSTVDPLALAAKGELAVIFLIVVCHIRAFNFSGHQGRTQIGLSLLLPCFPILHESSAHAMAG